MVLADTPRAMPYTPSVVSHMWVSMRLSEAPLCEMTSGSQGPAML